ncbi:hypothetical protein GGF31_003754 [Allomyces arbusculus]|nr:hypothetical protein GGF31_003754 [Allomyces arbusculus]
MSTRTRTCLATPSIIVTGENARNRRSGSVASSSSTWSAPSSASPSGTPASSPPTPATYLGTASPLLTPIPANSPVLASSKNFVQKIFTQLNMYQFSKINRAPRGSQSADAKEYEFAHEHFTPDGSRLALIKRQQGQPSSSPSSSLLSSAVGAASSRAESESSSQSTNADSPAPVAPGIKSVAEGDSADVSTHIQLLHHQVHELTGKVDTQRSEIETLRAKVQALSPYQDLAQELSIMKKAMQDVQLLRQTVANLQNVLAANSIIVGRSIISPSVTPQLLPSMTSAFAPRPSNDAVYPQCIAPSAISAQPISATAAPMTTASMMLSPQYSENMAAVPSSSLAVFGLPQVSSSGMDMMDALHMAPPYDASAEATAAAFAAFAAATASWYPPASPQSEGQLMEVPSSVAAPPAHDPWARS